eukprot:Selendium_serpulae@DN4895_c0_g1_i1.p1
MLGPTGVGFLYGKRELLEAMPPWKGGGEMIRHVKTSGTTFNNLPYKFEAGTPPIAEVVGLGAACDYINKLGLNEIEEYEHRLTLILWERLSQIADLELFGPPPGPLSSSQSPLLSRRAVPLVAFVHRYLHPTDLSIFVDRKGCALRAGHHCAQPLHDEVLKRRSTIRASLYAYNTEEEIDRFAEHLQSSIATLNRIRGGRKAE